MTLFYSAVNSGLVVILLRRLLSGARCFLMCIICSVLEPANYCIVVSRRCGHWCLLLGGSESFFFLV
jgi:hypothetical protein